MRPPTASPQDVRFEDAPRFDRVLQTSLLASLDQVKVTDFAPGTTPRTLPPRLERWLYAIQTSGGTVDHFPEPPLDAPPNAELDITALLAVMIPLVIRVWQEAADYLRYRPATQYDAVVYSRPSDNQVTRVVFFKRN